MFKTTFIVILLLIIVYIFYKIFRYEHFTDKECNGLNKLQSPQFVENRLKKFITIMFIVI